jgi:hypothetical protein
MLPMFIENRRDGFRVELQVSTLVNNFTSISRYYNNIVRRLTEEEDGGRGIRKSNFL